MFVRADGLLDLQSEARPVEEVIRFTSATAILKCQKPGRCLGAPNRQAVEHFLYTA